MIHVDASINPERLVVTIGSISSRAMQLHDERPPGRRYKALLTSGAEQDLEAIYDYIAEYDSVANAEHVLDRLLDVTESLANFPERGSRCRELIASGIHEYRQTFFKPYR